MVSVVKISWSNLDKYKIIWANTKLCKSLCKKLCGELCKKLRRNYRQKENGLGLHAYKNKIM